MLLGKFSAGWNTFQINTREKAEYSRILEAVYKCAPVPRKALARGSHRGGGQPKLKRLEIFASSRAKAADAYAAGNIDSDNN